jgi:hypothetical protein
MLLGHLNCATRAVSLYPSARTVALVVRQSAIFSAASRQVPADAAAQTFGATSLYVLVAEHV